MSYPMSATFERAMRQGEVSADAKSWLEPPIELRLNRVLKEKVATLGGLRGTARENPMQLAQAINHLLEKF